MPKRVFRFQSVDSNVRTPEAEVEVIFEEYAQVGETEFTKQVQHWTRIKLADLISPFDLTKADRVDAIAAERSQVPAADRTVPIDHNSREYKVAHAALDAFEHELRTTTAPISAQDREQRGKELSALRQILSSTRANVMVVVTLATPIVVYVAKKFADSGLGMAAKWRGRSW